MEIFTTITKACRKFKNISLECQAELCTKKTKFCFVKYASASQFVCFFMFKTLVQNNFFCFQSDEKRKNESCSKSWKTNLAASPNPLIPTSNGLFCCGPAFMQRIFKRKSCEISNKIFWLSIDSADFSWGRYIKIYPCYLCEKRFVHRKDR